MKKLVFLLPIAAIAMASCSNDSVVEQPATQIVSAEALQVYPEIQGLTRGTVWTNSNFTAFHLNTQGDGFVKNADGTGDAADINANVTKTDGKWVIPGATTYYWASKKSQNSFSAYAPTTVNLASYTADNSDLSKLEDIVVAYNSGTGSDFAAGVPLNFRHATSQIVVKADNAASDEVTIEVKAIRLNNIKNSGGFSMPSSSTVDNDLTSSMWTLNSTTANYKAECSAITLNTTAVDITGSNPLLLLPQQLGTASIGDATGQYLSVLVKITDASDPTTLIYPKNAEGTGYAWAAVDINTNWVPGKKYIYTLHFTKDGYGKIDKKQDDGGTDKPGSEDPDNPGADDPQPGEDVVDTPVELILDVTVTDWVDAAESLDM